MIEPAESLSDVLERLQQFIMEHGAALPGVTRKHVLVYANHPSPVERIVNTAEALYAIKGELPKEGRDITAKLAQFAAVRGYHDMTERGQKIAQAMNRLGGYAAPEGTNWPAAEDDPAPLERFVSALEPDEAVEEIAEEPAS